eukprot:CAMPEP_0180035328 /NCGR_PEP_ID=MMETSP0984-20121128/30199_1 /TAXON_ID=483367 /ORGANISM="non described non described, Strain CCMP 2436" /LENGTH=76 /DNA_ID=CAMNT_0021961157 /DNA_START=665 /DNA_END=892 /DNA_ORIENTATION=-
MRDRPLEHLKVAMGSCEHGCVCIPIAAVVVRPDEHVQVTTRSGSLSDAPVPRAAARAQPAQAHELPVLGGVRAQLH